jgi:hypothetical protein
VWRYRFKDAKAETTNLFRKMLRHALLPGKMLLQFNPIDTVELKSIAERNKENEFGRLAQAFQT